MIERALIAAVLALAGLAGWQTLQLSKERTAHQTTKTQAAEAKAAYANERTRVAVELGKSITQALSVQQSLMDQAAQAQEEKHAQVFAARADADRLRDRLRAQQSQTRHAAADVPSAAEAATSVQALPSGAVIPERVGDGLVSLALRADELRAHLQACHRQYDGARAALEAMK